MRQPHVAFRTVSPPKQPLPAACRGDIGGSCGADRVMPAVEEPLGDEDEEKNEPLAQGENGHQQPQEHDDDDGQEAQEPKSGLLPHKPSASEIERHRIAHFPYRRWCPECVMGQAIGQQHTTHKSESSRSKIPVIGLDYFFINDKGEVSAKGENDENGSDSAKIDEKVAAGQLV